MDLSFIIVNYKGREVTSDCLASINHAKLDCSYEVIVVDNHSEDGSSAFLKENFPAAIVLETPRNGGFAYANNIGAKMAQGEFIVLLNNDTLLKSHVLDRMLRFFKEQKNIGAMGCRCVNRDGLEIPASHGFSSQRSLARQVYIKPIFEKLGLQRKLMARMIKTVYSKPSPVDWLTGSFILMPRELYLEMGGLDEGFFLYMEDEDLCRRIRKRGFDIMLWPEIGYTHLCGASTQPSAFILLEYMKSKVRYYSIYDCTKLKQYLRLITRQLKQFGRSLPKDELKRVEIGFAQFVGGLQIEKL